jgi:uncharacterized membrane protein
VAHVARSIEVEEPVQALYEQWMRFEELPRCAEHSLDAHVRWRAEVLTFEPKGSCTRVTLRIEYDPSRPDPALPARVERTLEGFRAFVAESAAAQRGAS